MKYINEKTDEGIKTIRCIDPKNYKTNIQYLKEVVYQVFTYRKNGRDAYISNRATKEYYNKM